MLILDEPTAGLDPKQINETRDLIKSLAGDHTIILSTHILPEVEQTCEQVSSSTKASWSPRTRSIIYKTARAARNPCCVEVAGRNGTLDSQVIQHRLEQVTGVSRVLLKQIPAEPLACFEVESRKDRFIRGDLARAIVESGWDLNELRPSAMSLEEIFLQLTGGEKAADSRTQPKSSRKESQQMRNIWIICRKELSSYFVSPVAYLLLTMFAIDLRVLLLELGRLFHLIAGMESQMRGQMHAHERERT